jgi:AcrR family transcriptional regulator
LNYIEYSEGVSNMKKAVKSSRKYDASRRQAQARHTRLAILHAAQRLFIERGYGQTTIAAVAAEAGVSAETIYGAFRNKATLLQRVWDITIGGDDEDIVFHERPEVMAIRNEPDLTKRFMLHAQLSTATARRITPLVRAVQAAADTDPAAANMFAEMGQQRLAGLTVMAREAAATGQLAVSEADCRDVVWACTDGSLWHQLVVERGWSDEQFARWLGEVWARTLVTPRARSERPRRRA